MRKKPTVAVIVLRRLLRAARARERAGLGCAAHRPARAAARRERDRTDLPGVGGAAQTRGRPVRRVRREKRAHADQSRNALENLGRDRRGADTRRSSSPSATSRVCERNGCVSALSAEEWTAIAEFERTFHVRQISQYVYPEPEFGLNWPSSGGAFEGVSARVTAAGESVFPYLRGPVSIGSGTWGYLSTPLEAGNFTTLVTDGGGSDALLGHLQTRRRPRRDGRHVRRQPVPDPVAAAAPRRARVGHARHLPRRPAQLPRAAGRRRVPAGRHLGPDDAHDRLQPRRRRADERRRRRPSGRMVESERACGSTWSSTAAAASNTEKNTLAATRC